jgi:hypothetical protein
MRVTTRCDAHHALVDSGIVSVAILSHSEHMGYGFAERWLYAFVRRIVERFQSAPQRGREKSWD